MAVATKNCWKHGIADSTFSAEFTEQVKNACIPPNDVKTRWNETVEMYSIALVLKPVFNKMITTIFDECWNYISFVVKMLLPLNKITTDLSSREIVTSDILYTIKNMKGLNKSITIFDDRWNFQWHTRWILARVL